MYEDVGEKTQQENVYNEDYYVQEKGNSDKANQVYEIERLATPSDYGNEALYEEMTARYYVRTACVYVIRGIYINFTVQV